MDDPLLRAFRCSRPNGKHMMRFLRRLPYLTYRCESCGYNFHPGE